MKIRIFSLIVVVLPLTTALFPPVVIALDDPHKSGVTCAICHQTPSSNWWTDQGATNGLCGQCHYPSSPNGDAVIHSITPTYGSIAMPCTQCHNPHYQKQLRTWKAAGYLATGTISAVTTTTLTRTGGSPGWSTDQWKGMLLIPDVRYLQYNYRIASNTASVLTIDTSRGDAIKLAYAAPGASFAITYGGLVKEAIGGYSVKFLRDTGVNSFADGDATRDGVCEVCHTRTTHFRAGGTAPDQLHTSIGSSAAGTRCIACHKHTSGFTGEDAGCLGCHDGPVGNRAAVGSRFRANSHHVQGVTVANQHCYQCHWEANDDGTINTAYHSGSSAPDSVVDLVIYGAGARPTSYTLNTTAIQYLANGSRPEINKLTTHCLGCHSTLNNATQPFAPGDTRTPKQYAWDGSSVENRYNQAGVVPWGKYTGAGITPKNTVQKAYSAHGNAVGNQGGWDLNETWPNTRNGSVNVQCFDCHNSHGSAAAGRTSSYSSATSSGGILKETSANQGGYIVNYAPEAGGSTDTKNAYNAGAALCFDCHQTQMEGVATPWGYGSTFGATQQILGYRDSLYFGPGASGHQQRFTYKGILSHKGGHFGASAPVPGATGTVDGLCTPCHDPHGVTNNTSKIALADKPYAVPLLKGTWLTSPYKEDTAPAINSQETIHDVNAGNAYHIDQNTFSTDLRVTVTGITQTETQFAGLCITCHPKNSLTNGANGGTWKSVDRIHESVKGWGANSKHKYSCSKCHTPHNSKLPRLMATNCLNTLHKGRVAYNAFPVLSGSDTCRGGCDAGDGSGSGNFPGNGSGSGSGINGSGSYSYSIACHEGQAADQSWNDTTQWFNDPPTVPTLIDEPNTASTSIQLQWNASTDPEGDAIQYYVEVDDASNFSSPNYNSGWISGTSYSLTVGENAWYWRVKAKAGAESGWSVTDTFMVSDGNAPPQVILLSPATGAFYNYYPTNIALQWNAVPPVAHYRLEVDNESGFSAPLVYDSGWITATAQSVPISAGGIYYWRVQARDPLTLATGVVSATRNFVVNKPPTEPVLIYEPDTASTSIQLQWNASTDPEGDAIQYYVEVDDAASFSPPDYSSGWVSGTTSYTLSLPLGSNTTLYWRVKARDVDSESGWSYTDSFIVSDGNAPPQVALASPATGAFYYTYPVNIAFQWTAVPPFAQYRLEVDNESGFSAPLVYDSGWTTVTSRTINISTAGTYYWRVQARDMVSFATGTVSNTWTINVNGQPTVPVLIDEPHTASTSITLDWNASTDPEGNTPLQYYAVVDDDPNFGSPNFGGVWQSGTSLSLTVGMNTTWYWRVKARDSWNAETAWSSTDIFAVADGTPPPAPTLSNPADGWVGWTACSTWSYGMTFSYYSEPATEYRVLVDDDPAFGSPNYDSAWSANPSWYADIGIATWYWKVGARDPVNPGTESWSASRSFTVYYGGDCSASCPVLYVWDGANYAFETDLFSRGILARKEAGVYIRPNPNDYYLLANAPAGKNGTYEIKIVEERSEIDYLDQMKLYAVDYPENRNVYAEPNRKGDPTYIPPEQTLHTVDKTERRPLSAIHLRTGADVAAKISGTDGDYLVFGENREFPSWETVEMDLGDLSTAPMIKLMINGAQAFPTTPEGASRVISIAGSNFYKLEVPDGVGGWVEKQGQLNMGNLGEFSRTMIIDVSNIFLAHLYRIRFSYATKSYIDSITFDTTTDEPVTITDLPLTGADLAYGGFNAKIPVFEDLTIHVYGNKIDKPFALLPGNYTRFGDITPLLPSVDDKFVIMGQAEELTLRFAIPAPVAAGNRRQLLFYGNGFYKAYKYANTRSVDPLPFAAMSNFPYDELLEHYPDDADHQRYRQEYNTRVQ